MFNSLINSSGLYNWLSPFVNIVTLDKSVKGSPSFDTDILILFIIGKAIKLPIAMQEEPDGSV